MAELLKLNLGSGKRPLPGYINVDKFGTPDLLYDLETLPWPWETSSVGDVVMHHVLEHLGQKTATYLGIIQEMYRVCAPGATIQIVVPHPRHDHFIGDPTHVRPVTAGSLALFSKAFNNDGIKRGYANTPLALYLDVDLETVSVSYVLEEPWATEYNSKQRSDADITRAMAQLNNVVREIRMILRVVKGC